MMILTRSVTNCLLIFGILLSPINAGARSYGDSLYPMAGSTVGSRVQPGILTVTTTKTGATVILGGTVVPYSVVTLASQVPGRVEFVGGYEGDWFEPGELLVAVDDDDLRARRQQVLAEISNSVSALRNEQVQYGREVWAPQSRDIGRVSGMGLPSLFDQFFTRNMGSAMGFGNPFLERQADLYSSGTRVGQAYGRHWGTYSRLQEIDAKLRDTRTIAPFTGVIVEKLAEIGDTVQPGQPLLRFADTRDLQIQVEVPARLMRSLRNDMVVPAVLDVGDKRVRARVAQIYPMANTVQHTVTVKFDLPLDVPAAPGMYAEVMIPDVNAPIRSLPMIPKSAILWRGSLPAVYVLNQQGQPELRLIRLGESVDANHVTVLSGIQPGDRLHAEPPAGMSSTWKPNPSGAPQ
jgi:multidrug efflux pump subunit AcrA (membrane-fusion protein)